MITHDMTMKQQQQHLLSIIIPTFNRPERLRQCLQSILDLDNGNHQIQTIVVNDGSTQSYESVVNLFHDKLTLIYLDQENQGPASARNHGANHATGDFLVFLDDDCALTPDWFKKVQENIDSNFVTGGHTINCLTKNLFSQASQVLIDYLYQYYNNDPDNGTFITSNNLIIPKHLYDKLGGFDLDFSDAAAEDRDFCDRLVHSKYPIKYRPDITIHHYHHMSLSSYLRQHYRYGYSAYLYHKKRAARYSATLRMEPPAFYSRLLLFPFRHRLSKAILISLLLFFSQGSNAIGYWHAKYRAIWKHKQHDK